MPGLAFSKPAMTLSRAFWTSSYSCSQRVISVAARAVPARPTARVSPAATKRSCMRKSLFLLKALGFARHGQTAKVDADQGTPGQPAVPCSVKAHTVDLASNPAPQQHFLNENLAVYQYDRRAQPQFTRRARTC